MSRTTKVRARPKRPDPVYISVPLPPDLYGRLDRLREETGIPIARFAVRAIKRATDGVEKNDGLTL